MFPHKCHNNLRADSFHRRETRPRRFSNLPVAMEYTPSIVREVRIVFQFFEGHVLFRKPRDPRTKQGRGQQGTKGGISTGRALKMTTAKHFLCLIVSNSPSLAVQKCLFFRCRNHVSGVVRLLTHSHRVRK